MCYKITTQKEWKCAKRVTKNKDEYLSIRVDPDMKEKLRTLADDLNYDNVADLVRDAILEKIDPSKKKGISSEVVKDMIRQALRDDPTILDGSLEHIVLRISSQRTAQR
jgi:Arc/MetJ-type ribon-helix-helix transcriptional regulator